MAIQVGVFGIMATIKSIRGALDTIRIYLELEQPIGGILGFFVELPTDGLDVKDITRFDLLHFIREKAEFQLKNLIEQHKGMEAIASIKELMIQKSEKVAANVRKILEIQADG